MHAITIILAKDLRERIRDGTLVLFGLILPLGLAFLFTGVFGGGSEESDFVAEYVVVDQDGGELAGLLSDDVLAQLEEQGVARITDAASEDEADQVVTEGQADAAFLVPEGFTTAIEGGEQATVHVIGAPDAPIETHVAQEIAEAFAAELSALQLTHSIVEPGAWSDAVSERFASFETPLSLAQEEETATRELDATTFHTAGLAYFFLFFAVMPSVTSLLRERGTGTLGRMLVSPIPRRSILLGKALSATIVGVVSMLVLMTASQALLGADWGPTLGVVLLVVSAASAAVAITAAVATFGRTSEQASNRLVMVVMALGLLGGAVIPVSQLDAVAVLSYLTPHHWFLFGLAELGGGSLFAVLLPVGVLLAMTVAAGGLALLRMGRMLHT